MLTKRTSSAIWYPDLKRWQVKVQKDGKRRTFTCSTPGRAGKLECHARADEWLASTQTESDMVYIDQLYGLWFASVKKTASKSHWCPLESRWRTHVIPVMGRKRLDKVTDGQWQDLIDSIYAEGKSKKTLQNYCSDIRAFYKWLRAHGYTMMRLEALHVPKGAESGERRVLKPDSLRVLFQSDLTTWRNNPCVDQLVRAYRFQVAAGLRPGEVIGLCWSDIVGYRGADTDWQKLSGTLVTIHRAVNVYGEITKGKNKNARRSFVMFPLLAQILEEQNRYTGKNTQVFPIRSESAYYEAWQKYCRANEIPPISLYELRHTFVSIVKVLPAGEVKSWVGHSKNMDTFGVYAHTLTSDGARAADDFGNLYRQLLGTNE